MNLFDARTVVFSYAISNFVCMIVIAILWRQNHKRLAGLGFWFADFMMQFFALVLIALRGIVPDFLSMTVSNTMVIGGTLLLFIGLEHFTGKRGPQVPNYFLLAAFIVVHAYFVFVLPNLAVRNIIISLGLLVICSQAAWLMLRRVEPGMHPITGGVGQVFLGFCLVSMARIIVDLIVPSENDFFHSNTYDTLLLITYQMLYIVLTFSLFLMVNRRLFVDLEGDIMARKQVEAELRLSEEKLLKAFHASPDAIIISRLSDGQFIEVNDGFCNLTGYSREDALFNSSIGLGLWVNLQDRERFVDDLRANHTIRENEYDFRAKSGKILNCILAAEIINLGSEAHILSVVRDITEHKRADEIFQMRFRLLEYAATHSLEELMQRALDEIGHVTASPIGFYHFVEADQKTLSLQAWSTRTQKEFCKAEGKGMHYSIDQAGVWVDCVRQRKAVIHNDYAALTHRKGLPAGHAEVVRELVVPILREERVVSILGVGNKPTDYDDKDVELVAYIADVIWEIIQRKRAEEKLQQLSRAVEQSPASIVITDTAASIEYVNPKFTEITGYTLEEAVGKNPRILKTDQTPKETHRQLWDAITSGREWRGEFVNRKKNGELFHEAASISPIIDNSGVTTHYVAVKEDITASKLNEQKLQQANRQLQLQLDQIQRLQTELREQAIRDPLTGLYNRRYLNEALERELARALRENYPISFVMIDIDHFKKINDTFGHDIGDVVLKKLAAQFLSQTRVVDIVCRYGGEEFLIILPNVMVAKALEITERWRKSFMGITMPLGTSNVQTTISCGISEFPLNGNTSEELISSADKAMYQAKAIGRNRVVVWQNELKE